MIINENNYEILKNVSDITSVDYEIRWFDAENIEGYIDVEGLFCMIQDLVLELDKEKEKYKELQQNIKENYVVKQFDPYDEYGVNESDFH